MGPSFHPSLTVRSRTWFGTTGTVECAANEWATGGGASAGDGMSLDTTQPIGNPPTGWRASYHSAASCEKDGAKCAGPSITVYAVCISR
jgi:hypothetical protein